MPPCLPACMHGQLLQWWITLCDPMDHSLPGSSVHGIFQVRIQQQIAISYSDLPNLRIEPVFPGSPTLQADSLPLSHLGNLIVFGYKSLQRSSGI